MAEWLEPTMFREVVRSGNKDALKRPGPKLLIVEGVRRFSHRATVFVAGSERFLLPIAAADFIVAGARVRLDLAEDQSRVVEPLDDHNQPFCRIPVTR